MEQHWRLVDANAFFRRQRLGFFPVPGICARARLKRRMRGQRSLHRWGSAGSAAAEEPTENARGRVTRRRALRRALRADDHRDCRALCQVYVPSRD